MQCFEEDINVPLIIRGPDVGKNKTTDLVTGHVDIVPTMLSLAGYGDDASYGDIGVVLDGTPISFPLEDEEDNERNDNARGETVSQTAEDVYTVVAGLDLVSLRVQARFYNDALARHSSSVVHKSVALPSLVLVERLSLTFQDPS